MNKQYKIMLILYMFTYVIVNLNKYVDK